MLVFLSKKPLKSGNETLRVKLSTAIDPTEAHTIDVKYHKRCWALNVTNVLRVGKSPEDRTSLAAEVAAEIEFTNLTESMLLD